MSRSLRVLALLLALAAFAAAPVAAAPKVLRNADLVAISTPGQVVRGIPGGGLPWVIAPGSKAKLAADGALQVVIHGLVFAPGTPFAGTTGPIDSVFASAVCADGSVADSDPVAISADGDAIIRATVDLPAGCADPIILVRVAGNGRWIAAAGL